MLTRIVRNKPMASVITYIKLIQYLAGHLEARRFLCDFETPIGAFNLIPRGVMG